MDEQFHSWAEIAAYLGIDIKTAQRWEKYRGLPVSRVPGGVRAQVRTTKSAIDAWLASGRQRDGAPDPPLGCSASWLAASRAGRSRLTTRILIWIALSCLLLAAATTAYFYRRASTRGAVARAEIVGNFLVARDKYARELWRYEFPSVPSPVPSLHNSWTELVFSISWTPGSSPEVIALVNLGTLGRPDPLLLCLNGSGQVRWQWKPRVDLHDFAGRRFEDFWMPEQILHGIAAGKGVIWLAVSNPARWASAVFEVDADGTRTIRFANAGSVQALAQPLDGPPRLIAAGINNAYDRPFIALIDLNGPPAFAPPGGPEHYTFSDGPTGLPLRYLLLPNSEIAAATSLPYFHVADLAIRDQGVVLKAIDNASRQTVIDYVLDEDLTPQMVRPTAALPSVHRQLEVEGKLRHAYQECPELHEPREFRDWTPARGWQTLKVPEREPKLAGKTGQ